ncbi:hypothetical protein C8Q79DRAFT_904837 [Trametes meyenii]|nr:hypothetical protein C8Q79DRAFT_904837 [Trametes meyenii]
MLTSISQRHLLLHLALRLYTGTQMRAEVYHYESTPLLPMPLYSEVGPDVIAEPGVNVYLPANILVRPIYVVVESLPAIQLPNPVMIAVQATEWFAGDKQTLEFHTDIRYVTRGETVRSRFLTLPRRLEDAVEAEVGLEVGEGEGEMPGEPQRRDDAALPIAVRVQSPEV